MRQTITMKQLKEMLAASDIHVIDGFRRLHVSLVNGCGCTVMTSKGQVRLKLADNKLELAKSNVDSGNMKAFRKLALISGGCVFSPASGKLTKPSNNE